MFRMFIPYLKKKDKCFMGTSNNSKFVTPVLRQEPESSHIKGFWIPAGVYPDKNRGRNDIFRGGLMFWSFSNV